MWILVCITIYTNYQSIFYSDPEVHSDVHSDVYSDVHSDVHSDMYPVSYSHSSEPKV